MALSKQFLSLGGNCAIIHILGKERIIGPLDNMKAKNGLSSIKSIFEEGGLENEFFNIGEIEQPFCGNHRDNKEIWFSTRNFFIIHNNFRELKFKQELQRRIDTLYKYLDDMKQDDSKFLLYSLCEKDIDPVNNKMSDLFIKGIDILKEKHLLDRVIFLMVRSKDKKWYDYICDDINKYSPLNLKLIIEINDLNSNRDAFLHKIQMLLDK